MPQLDLYIWCHFIIFGLCIYIYIFLCIYISILKLVKIFYYRNYFKVLLIFFEKQIGFIINILNYYYLNEYIFLIYEKLLIYKNLSSFFFLISIYYYKLKKMILLYTNNYNINASFINFIEYIIDLHGSLYKYLFSYPRIQNRKLIQLISYTDFDWFFNLYIEFLSSNIKNFILVFNNRLELFSNYLTIYELYYFKNFIFNQEIKKSKYPVTNITKFPSFR